MGQKLNKLTRVWICEPHRENVDGEYKTVWKIKTINKKEIYLNLQQDLNELDRNSAGEVDYDIQKARTTIGYSIEKGNGICFKDVTKEQKIIPDYEVTAISKIGNTHIYTLKKYNGV